MELDLFTIFSNPKFVMSNNCTELKHNIGLICEELTGFHTQEKSLHSQTIAIIRRFKKKKKSLVAILKCQCDQMFLSSHKVKLETQLNQDNITYDITDQLLIEALNELHYDTKVACKVTDK